ncbi:MAG: protein translocase subunit SecF [Gammaproteobacteria bacterium]|nr:protein translocase subunit SecF [Gammaproteobacteria bacterium]
MEFFKQNTKIDFMAQRKWAYIFSSILFIFSVVSLFVNHLNFGLDFTGGVQIQAAFQNPPDTNQIREKLHQAGFEALVQAYGSSRDVMIRIKTHKELTREQLTDQVMNIFPDAKKQRVEYVGPQIGKTLFTDGILAIVFALLGTMIYIALRFEYRFAVSAAISLIHDPILILGLFSFFHIEFDLIALAAVLTVIGYSLNDTIVVYDRVRENFRKLRKASAVEIFNLSVNQTLSRTLMTSGLTFSLVLALFIFGGQMLHGFALAMIIGIVIGTYSSIYVAGALALLFGLDKKHLIPVEKKYIDNMP